MNTSLLSRHERRRQQTRHKLIQAAVELALEKGFDAINIQDITDRADLGRGTFYLHFKDKEEVIWSAIRDLILELEQRAHRQFEAHLPEQVEYYGLLNIFQHAEENRDLYRVILGAKGSANLTGRVQDLMAQVFLTDIRRVGREDSAAVPNEIWAQLLTGMISRLIFWWLETPSPYSAMQMAGMAYQAIHHQIPPGEK